MEELRKENSGFIGIISDGNPTGIDASKFAADNFNGRFAQIGKNNFAWKAENGSAMTYKLPEFQGREASIQNHISKYFVFDNRISEKDVVSSLNQQRVPITPYYYRYSAKFTTINKGFTATTGIYPSVEFQFTHMVHYDHDGNINIIEFSYKRKRSTDAAFSAQVDISIDPTGTKEVVLSRLVSAYLDCFIDTGTVYTNTIFHEAILNNDVNGVLIEVTKPVNINIEIYEHPSAETATNFVRNRFGFGRGAKFGGYMFPNAPEYPVPGSDYKLNPFTSEQPQGVVKKLKNNQRYYVATGKVVIVNGVSSVAYGPGELSNTFVYDSNIENISPNSSCQFIDNPTIVEVNPAGFGYGMTIRRYAELTKETKGTYSIVKAQELSKDEVLIFGAYETKKILIYYNFVKKQETIVLQTDENLDFGEESVLLAEARYDNEIKCDVIWTSGTGHVRIVNVFDPPTSDFDFNTRLFKPCDFGNVFVQNVFRNGGALLVGSYRSCFALSTDGINYTRCSQLSQPVMIGNSYWGIEKIIGSGDQRTVGYPMAVKETDASYRGAPAGTKTTESIEFAITNIDPRYKYIKVYSVEAISGSGSFVVNEILSKRLTVSEYQYLSVIHSGEASVIRGNLPLSTVNSQVKVPYDVKFIRQIANRLVIANFKQDIKLREEGYENPIVVTKARQKIGCDTTTQDTTPGHKHWLNQVNFKSLNYKNNDVYAWVFIDEYGNESEPMTPFEVSTTFYERSHFSFDPNKPHVQGNVNYERMYESDETKGKASQETLFPDTIAKFNSFCAIKGGFDLFSFGYNLKINNPQFPAWAKKAILVRKSVSVQNRKQIAQGFGILRDGYIQLGYTPEFNGYNNFENIVFKRGQKIRILGIYITKESMNGFWWDPYAYMFLDAYQKVDHEKHVYEIQKIKQDRYPYENEKNANYNEERMPPDTIKTAGIEFYANYDYADLMAISLPVVYEKAVRLVYFQIESDYEEGQNPIEKYESTGYELDLRFRYKPEYERAFIGEYFNSTNHQILTIRTRYYINTYLGAIYDLDVFTPFYNSNAVNLFPLLTRFNMAMADDSVFPFYRMNPLIKTHTAWGFRTYNRDYAKPIEINTYQYLDVTEFPVRSVFNNVFIYSNQRVIGSEREVYSVFLENNQIEVPVEYGPISGVYEVGNYILVVQEKGCRSFVFQAKEFIQTTTGSLITTGSGSFLDGTIINRSKTAGSKYPGVQTDNGVYFFDETNSVLYFANEKELKAHSIEAGYTEFLKQYQAKPGINNYKKLNGVHLFYDRERRLVCLLMTYFHEDLDGEMISDAVFMSKQPWFKVEKGQAIMYQNGSQLITGYVDLVVETIEEIRVFIVQKRTYNIALKPSGTLIVLTPKSPCTFFINEERAGLEFRTDKAIDALFKNGIYSDIITNHCLNLPLSEASLTKTSNELFGAKWNVTNLTNLNAYNVALNFNIQNGEISPENTINLWANPGFLNYTGILLASKRQMLFVEGCVYSIDFEWFYKSGGGPNRPFITAMPLPILAFNYTDMNEQQWFESTTGEPGTRAIVFKVKKTFVSPIVIYGYGVDQTTFSITNKISISFYSISIVKESESYLEVYAHNSGEMVSLDNIVVAGQKLELFDRVEIFSSSQNAKISFDVGFKAMKNRINQIMIAVPKLSTKERARSNWFKVKFVYSTAKESIIENVTTFMRTIYGK